MQNAFRTIAALSACFAVCCVVARSQTVSRSRHQRAKLPAFDAAETQRVFFANALDVLQGERPQRLFASEESSENSGKPAPATGVDTPATDASATWSAIVSTATLEDEIKKLAGELTRDLSNPGQFQRGDHLRCRDHFTVVAILMAVAGRYEGPIRWRDDGAAAGRLFARTAQLCRAGSPQVFQEAKRRLEDLQDLLSGNSLPPSSEEEPPDNWVGLAERTVLMEQLELAEQDVLQPGTANAKVFAQQASKLAHEAELVAVFAETLVQEGMDEAEDEEYQLYASMLRDAAVRVAESAREAQYERGRAAMGDISKSCSACHDVFR